MRRLESEKENYVEKLITQKQEYSAETNHLRITLTGVEDSAIKAKLECCQIAMEKDMLNLNLIEAAR